MEPTSVAHTKKSILCDLQLYRHIIFIYIFQNQPDSIRTQLQVEIRGKYKTETSASDIPNQSHQQGKVRYNKCDQQSEEDKEKTAWNDRGLDSENSSIF